MRRSVCASCDGELTSFLDLGSTPLANTLPGSAAAEETWYPLEVAVCTSCWLVQLLEVVPDGEIYGEHYSFRTATAGSAGYFSGVANNLLDRYPAQARRLTVEIACNDGTLLQRFADAKCDTLGIEPSGAAVDALARGLRVMTEPWTLKLADEARELLDSAGLILAFNVMAHVPDPRDFLAGVRLMLADDGVAVIEFQDFAALAAGCQFDHVYHEHRFFYSLASFSRLAHRCGLELFDWDRPLVQGGSIRAYLRPGTRLGLDIGPDERWLEDVTVYRCMQGRADFARQNLLELVWAELDEGRSIAGYGATAKACTLLNFCGFGPDHIQWVGDTTPGKIGRFVPGTGIPICAFGESVPDTYLLTAWSYFSSVIRREREFLDGGGKFILPGAVPVIL